MAATSGTREATHANSWYKGESDTLSSELEEYLSLVPEALDDSSLPISGARVIIAP